MSAGGVPALRGTAGAHEASLDLIHRNNCSKPVFMRVAARFDARNGFPVQFLKVPCPLSFLMGWRAANGANSRT